MACNFTRLKFEEKVFLEQNFLQFLTAGPEERLILQA